MKIGEIWRVKEKHLITPGDDIELLVLRVRIRRMMIGWVYCDIVECKFANESDLTMDILEQYENNVSMERETFLKYYEKEY